MATALIYVLVLLAVAAVIFVGVSTLFGRGEELAPIPKGASPTWLPDTGISGADVRAVRFQQAVRGYRMSEVDWVLDQVAGELERLRSRVGELERGRDGTASVEPTPGDPDPVNPDRVDPAPDGPTSSGPTSSEPTSSEPTSSEATDSEPAPEPIQEHTEA